MCHLAGGLQEPLQGTGHMAVFPYSRDPEPGGTDCTESWISGLVGPQRPSAESTSVGAAGTQGFLTEATVQVQLGGVPRRGLGTRTGGPWTLCAVSSLSRSVASGDGNSFPILWPESAERELPESQVCQLQSCVQSQPTPQLTPFCPCLLFCEMEIRAKPALERLLGGLSKLKQGMVPAT